MIRNAILFFVSYRNKTNCFNRAEVTLASAISNVHHLRVQFDYLLQTTKTSPRMFNNRVPRANRSYDIHLTRVQ